MDAVTAPEYAGGTAQLLIGRVNLRRRDNLLMDMDAMAYILILAAAFVLAVRIGYVWVLGAVIAGWGIFFPGLTMGWWGASVGDGWRLAMGMLMCTAAVGAALGVGLRTLIRRNRAGAQNGNR